MLIEKTEVLYFNDVAERQRIENGFVDGPLRTQLLQHLQYILANDFMSAYAIYKLMKADDTDWYLNSTLLSVMHEIAFAEVRRKTLGPSPTNLEIIKSGYPHLRIL
jgi:cation transport regulator ChaB